MSMFIGDAALLGSRDGSGWNFVGEPGQGL